MEDSLMDSDINAPAASDNKPWDCPASQEKPWQWIMASPTRMVGLILLVLALVLLLALMVLVSQKSAKKKVETNIPQATPNVQKPINTLPAASPLPDLTKDWKTYNGITGISFKYPVGPKVELKPGISTDSASVVLQLNPDIKETESPALVIESAVKRSPYLKNYTLSELLNFDYTSVASLSSTSRMITKPIEILIGGNRGYEYYFEGDKFVGKNGLYKFKSGKIRVVQFEGGDKFYTILASLDEKIEQILNTLMIIQTPKSLSTF